MKEYPEYKRNVRFTVALVFTLLLLTQSFALGRDLTFFVWSDSHFGAFDYSDTTRLKIIDRMNNLAGTKYPAGIFGDTKVSRPAFLLHLGDITEHGYQSEFNDPNIADQRSYLQTIKHLTATDRVYEVIGNHDSRKAANIRKSFAQRHKKMYYSFDIQGVHFVILDAYHYNNTAAPDIDEEQFDWLRDDLGKLKDTTPIIIAIHVQPNSRYKTNRTARPSDKTSDCLWNIISDKNVIAFLHGHHHIVKHTRWFEYDVLAPAGFAYMRKACPPGKPLFGVIRITDNEMTALAYDWHKGQFVSKPSLRKQFKAD